MLIRHIFSDILSEARRNPDINKKESALSVLEKYRNRDVFVSFTHNVGAYTNDKSENYLDIDGVKTFGQNSEVHNTTGAKLGINPKVEYATPVGIYTYPINYVLEKKGRMPFAAERPYIWVIEPTGKVLNLDEYSETDFFDDVGRLEEYYDVNDLIEDAQNTAKTKTPGGYIWNLTRLIAKTQAEHSPRRFKKSKTHASEYDIELLTAKFWTKIFRQLGYAGVSDMVDRGIIHENEPTQAVFFGMDGIKILNLVRNIVPAQPMSQMAIWRKQPKAFEAAVKKGLPDDKIIDALEVYPDFIDYLPFISEKVKEYIIDKVTNFVTNFPQRYMHFLDRLSSEDGFIDLLKEHPRLYRAMFNEIRRGNITLSSSMKDYIFTNGDVLDFEQLLLNRAMLPEDYLRYFEILNSDDKKNIFLQKISQWVDAKPFLARGFVLCFAKVSPDFAERFAEKFLMNTSQVFKNKLCDVQPELEQLFFPDWSKQVARLKSQ